MAAQLLQPPSMICTVPVVYELASEARYSANWAISSVVPMRPIG